MHRKLQMVALLALAVLCQQAVGRRPLQVPPSSAGGALGQCTTVYQQLATNPDLSTLKAAVDTAGLRGGSLRGHHAPVSAAAPMRVAHAGS